MAPEGIEGGSPTDKRDVWAFAMTVLVRSSGSCHLSHTNGVLQELFTGQVPFEDIKAEKSIFVRVLRGMPNRPHRMRDEWWALCTPCWESNPTLRPTMMDLIRRIERVSPLTLGSDNLKRRLNTTDHYFIPKALR